LDGRLVNPHEVLEIYFKYYCSLYAFESAAKRSVMNIQILLVNLIQGVYKDQGIYISNKHVEVIVRQITSKVKISELKTETGFEVGEFLEFEQARYINMALKSTKKTMIEYQPILLGITKVSLMTESFISAASFQETTRVLTKAAVEGKVEWLRGLKENVILGRLVPAGTGFKSFNSLDLLNVRLS
jgi:DNA-directed RNA polymerase subunit beta'